MSSGYIDLNFLLRRDYDNNDSLVFWFMK